ncbi:MAG: ABC transporter ATP-binding protein [Pseudomonadales bacterium]|jgi:lipopolysaccharide transport system ATP-binding protein|nr:ABC transporter ATP-binding protein [Pseudomonadales bacterium]
MLEVDNLGKKYLKQSRLGTDFPTLRDKLDLFNKKPSKEVFWALQNVSFSLNQGDTLGVIGHNGAGKSTLFKIISRITVPSAGEVQLYGRVASLLEVGTGFHPELSGRENVFLSGAILGMKRHEIKKKFKEIVDFAEIEDFIDQPVKHYSSGMYMRLAFAIAAFLTSEIMIIDEVLAVGDRSFQKKCLAKIKEISTEQNRTVLLVSHNINNVKKLCNKCLWLDHGQSKLFGDTKLVTEAYEKSTL